MAPLDYKGNISRYRRYLAAVREKPVMRDGFFLIMSLLLVIVLIFAALRPTFITIAGLVGEINQKKDVEKRMDEKIKQVSASQKDYQQVLLKMAILDSAIPKEAEIDSWARAMATVASSSGTEITEITLSNVPVKGAVASPRELTELGFTLTAAADYPGARQFIEKIENLRRLIRVETVGILKATKEENKVTFSVKGVVGMSL